MRQLSLPVTAFALTLLFVPPAFADQAPATREEILERQHLEQLEITVAQMPQPQRDAVPGDMPSQADTGRDAWVAASLTAAGGVVGSAAQMALQGGGMPWAGLFLGAIAGNGLYGVWNTIDTSRVPASRRSEVGSGFRP